MNIKSLAKKHGVEYKERGNGHIQLKGALLVNYYPQSKAKTAYIAGTTEGKKNVTPKQAIQMCFTEPSGIKKKDKRKGNSRLKRQRMIDKGIKNCHWCGVEIDIDSSTLEHIIPLDKGGLENANNRTLACEKCNNERGNKMIELEALK